jgi:hypothetical protein
MNNVEEFILALKKRVAPENMDYRYDQMRESFGLVGVPDGGCAQTKDELAASVAGNLLHAAGIARRNYSYTEIRDLFTRLALREMR